MNYEKTTNGVMYTEDITSVNGASFILFPEGKHTVKMIKEAITELMNSRDVVGMRVANEDDRDDLYRTEIFRHPATRPLKWYEINADNKTTHTDGTAERHERGRLCELLRVAVYRPNQSAQLSAVRR